MTDLTTWRDAVPDYPHMPASDNQPAAWPGRDQLVSALADLRDLARMASAAASRPARRRLDPRDQSPAANLARDQRRALHRATADLRLLQEAAQALIDQTLAGQPWLAPAELRALITPAVPDRDELDTVTERTTLDDGDLPY